MNDITEYELRKLMLSEMDSKEISTMIYNKKRELASVVVPTSLVPELAWYAKSLWLTLDFVCNEALHCFREPITSLIEMLERELKLRSWERNEIDLESLKRSVPIIDVVNSYWHEVKHWRNIRCPFHEDRTASMHIYSNTNSFKCFGCQTWGTQIDFIMKSDNCSISQAIRKLKSFWHSE